jgi:flagellar assembly protein FliH
MLEQAQTAAATLAVYPLEYRAIVAAGLDVSPNPVTDLAPGPDPAVLEARVRELERELEDRSRSFESAIEGTRAEAYDAGKMSERTEHSARLASASQALTASLAEFTAARDHYLARVEHEVVSLALAIAARILHRETTMDPLLLTGAVRVALGQLAEKTEAQLRVPAAEYDLWQEMLRLMPNLPLHPAVIADEAFTAGQCQLETHLGNVDLGVRSQLAEIERGFFDLLEHRSESATLPNHA